MENVLKINIKLGLVLGENKKKVLKKNEVNYGFMITLLKEKAAIKYFN